MNLHNVFQEENASLIDEKSIPLLHGEEERTTPSKKRDKEEYGAQFDAFKEAFDLEKNAEIKLQLVINFMESALSQGGNPHFRSFWEARRFCLPLFKENIPPAVRNQLWIKYSTISKEARQLKELLDEQSAFAVEQIDIAIQAVEREMTQFDEQVEKTELSEEFVFPQTLREKAPIYQKLQKQLNILNVHAARINSLRKELLKIDMRIKHKNNFFQRLSAAGDQIFPKRKELIRQISQQFVEDINAFIDVNFGETAAESFYILREEIKALQGLAKVFTLNTNSFTQTRMRLSECWDRIRVEEKERKKERAQQRLVFKQNADEIMQRLQEVQNSIENKEITVGEAGKKVDSIIADMRRVELGREDLKTLKESIHQIRTYIQNQAKAEEDQRYNYEQEKVRQRKEKYQLLKDQSTSLIQNYATLDVNQLSADRDLLMVQIQEGSFLSKTEKQELDRILKPLRDIIIEKREQAMLSLSDDDKQSLQQLQDILKQRKERRQEIKNQLEILRKASGTSNLDFEKAMNFQIQINEEKERLEKATQGIEEIENKITHLKSQLRN